MMSGTPDIQQKYITWLILCVLAFLFFRHLLFPIWDIDVWWHMASGRWIVENNRLPSSDPFSVFSAQNQTRTDIVLTGQWLGQVILYKIHHYFSNDGLVIFRALLLSSFLFLTYIRTRLLNLSATVSLFLICLIGFNLFAFTGLRPQLFGFAIALFVFLLIDGFEKTGKTGYLMPLPVIAVLWANIHGSFILGIVLLLMYSISIIVEHRQRQKQLSRNLKILFFIAVAFALFSTINPNGFEAIRYISELRNSDLQVRTSEYTSAFKMYTYGYFLAQSWIYLFYLLTLIALPKLFQLSLGKTIITLFLAAISIDSFRYYLFFLLISGPYVIQAITHYVRVQQFIDFISCKRSANFIFYTLLCFASFALLQTRYTHPPGINNINPSRYPIVLGRYAKDQNIKGYMFNYFGWGGYLIWNLHPNIRPYIDGRMLDDTKLDKYMNILWATNEGIRYFNNEHFDYVMIPYFKPGTKQIYSLNLYLQNQPDWIAIYRGNLGLLFKKIAEPHAPKQASGSAYFYPTSTRLSR